MLCLWLCWEWLRPSLGKRAAASADPEWCKKKCLRTIKDLVPYDDYLKRMFADNPDIDPKSMHTQLEQDKQETVELAAIKKWLKDLLQANVTAADLETFYGELLVSVHVDVPSLGSRQLKN